MRILVTRTDKMGDVILSIPALRHLRKVSPDAYIAFMVASKNRELVENEKDIDEVIAYDKILGVRGFFSDLKFILELRKKKFDLAIALHPAKRTHIILYASGIPIRVGYDNKWGKLLTSRLSHGKQSGEKHEVDYNLDVISFAGFDISGADSKPRVIPTGEALRKVGLLIKEFGITKGNMIALHTGSSCRSKMWPLERFAEAADLLSEKYSADIVVVGEEVCPKSAHPMENLMKKRQIDLTGKLGLSDLAALFSMCRLVISNDSGPAHMAAAVGAPVIVIFGRNDPGLSPKRWAPVSDKKRILHSPSECSPCLAHNCEKGFLCLNNISAQDVVSAASEMLG